jgi:DeoR family transcriptional regulator of aga operon/DeoR family fructose operon transcriptional repressor
LINHGDTLFINRGTTTMEVVKELGLKKNLTVITNSILIAQELIKTNADCRIILLGGELRREEQTLYGTITDSNLEQFYATKAILGIGGISPETGITDYYLQETNTLRIMIQRSAEVIAVADSSKFGVVAMNFICPLEKIHTLVTDWTAPAKIMAEYRSRGLKVHVAPPS